jgi:hypothetical protein
MKIEIKYKKNALAPASLINIEIDVDKFDLNTLRNHLLEKFEDRFKQAEALQGHGLKIFGSWLAGGMGEYGVIKSLALKSKINTAAKTSQLIQAVTAEASKSDDENGGLFSPQLRSWLVETLVTETERAQVLKASHFVYKQEYNYLVQSHRIYEENRGNYQLPRDLDPFNVWANSRLYDQIFSQISGQVNTQNREMKTLERR